MPTYQNSSSIWIEVDGYNFAPYNTDGDTKVTTKILTHSDLTTLSNAPYYNPLLANTTVTGTNETVTHDTEITASSIRLVPLLGTITIYVNSLSNLPGISLEESMTLNNNGQIDTLYVNFSGAGEVLIQELK